MRQRRETEEAMALRKEQECLERLEKRNTQNSRKKEGGKETEEGNETTGATE